MSLLDAVYTHSRIKRAAIADTSRPPAAAVFDFLGMIRNDFIFLAFKTRPRFSALPGLGLLIRTLAALGVLFRHSSSTSDVAQNCYRFHTVNFLRNFR